MEPDAELQKGLLEQAQAFIKHEYLDRARAKGINCSIDLLCEDQSHSNVGELILQQARKQRADLIVVVSLGWGDTVLLISRLSPAQRRTCLHMTNLHLKTGEPQAVVVGSLDDAFSIEVYLRTRRNSRGYLPLKFKQYRLK